MTMTILMVMPPSCALPLTSINPKPTTLHYSPFSSSPTPKLLTSPFSNTCTQDLHSKVCPVICMAHPRRVKMVAQQIKREVAVMLLEDKVLREAVLPEAALGADMCLSSVTTVSDVQISRDLQVAKVYISVFGDERGQDIAMKGLKAKEKYVRMQLGRRVQLRLTPEVRFIHDDSLERGSRVIALLDKLKAEREQDKGETGNFSASLEHTIKEEDED